MAFPDAWMDELLERTDLVSLISSYCTLKPKGKHLWGLCPIHGEKTPSFSVTPEKKMFYCFGCHAGGTAIQFLMQVEHMTFIDAVKNLAERCNMQLPDDTKNDAEFAKEREKKDKLYKICNAAARFYMETLLDKDKGMTGRQYFSKRGISSDSVKRFGLGYAQDGWDHLKKHLISQGFSENDIVDAGLLIKNETKNSTYDAYRNRVIFPIIGTNQNVIGFGARVLDNSKPKYINTGDTEIYNKRNNLYGLNLQKGTKRNNLVIVEGYTDVIALFEAGVDNVVASLGTALTVQQARLIKRYVPTVYIAYDGDSAGQNATLRGLDILSEEGLDVRVIVFPDNLDPDEFTRKYGKEGFDKLKDNSLSLPSFKLSCMSKQYNLNSAPEREKFALEACKYIASLQPIQQKNCLKQVAKLTGYSEDDLQNQTNSSGTLLKEEQPTVHKTYKQTSRDEKEVDSVEVAQNQLFQYSIKSEEAFQIANSLNAFKYLSDEGKDFIDMLKGSGIKEDFNKQISLSVAKLDSSTSGKILNLINDNIATSDVTKSIKDCINRIKLLTFKKQLDELNQIISNKSTSSEDMQKALKDVVEINKQIRMISK